MKSYYIYKAARRIFWKISAISDKIRTFIIFWGNNVHYQDFTTNGVPYIMVSNSGKCSIGRHFAMNNKLSGGAVRRSNFFVAKGAEIIIGDHVGISATTLGSCKKIAIGNHVVIGTGVCIFDSDFHALDPSVRAGDADDTKKVMKKVVIEDHVFIGAYSIILKGVTIGKNSIVGAGSVVRESIPPNQIWAGNPAKFIIDIF